MNDTRPSRMVLDDWRIEAFPVDWNPQDTERPIRAVTVDGGLTTATVPERFYLVLQSPAALKAPEPTAIVVALAADKKSVDVIHVFGVGDDWLTHLADTIKYVPPTEWVRLATKKAVAFMIDRIVLADLGPFINELALPATGGGTPVPPSGQPGIQQRRKITPEHLREVAATYTEAQEYNAPPTRTVAEMYDVSHSTAAKWVGKARAAGYLPPVSGDEE